METRPQTDRVYNVDCVTIEGVQLKFDKIEIENKLPESKVIYTISKFTENYDELWVKDKVQHQMNIICSKLTVQEIRTEYFDMLDDLLLQHLQETNDAYHTGIQFLYVRLSKPSLPASLSKQFESLAEERARSAVLQKAAENQALQNAINAKSADGKAAELLIASDGANRVKENIAISEQKISAINDETRIAAANANSTIIMMLAKDEQAKYTFLYLCKKYFIK